MIRSRKARFRCRCSVLLCLPLLGLLAMASCTSSRRDFRDLAVDGLSKDALWRICVDVAQTEFRVDPAQVDLGRRTFTTRWRNELRAFGQGKRRRAHFEIKDGEPKPAAASAGKGTREPNAPLKLRFYVEVERYTEMTRPLKPEEDKWKYVGQDVGGEARLFRHLTIRVDQARGKSLRKTERIRIEDPLRRR